eukprot:UN16364
MLPSLLFKEINTWNSNPDINLYSQGEKALVVAKLAGVHSENLEILIKTIF